MIKSDIIKINKNVKNSFEIFNLTEDKFYEISNSIHDWINNIEEFELSNEIEYLQNKYKDLNEFIFAIYVLGIEIKSAHENKIIMTEWEKNKSKEMILDKYFETDCKLH